MGEESTPRPMMAAWIGGEWREINPISVAPILDASLSPGPALWPQETIALQAKLPKYFRCKSRKRLIKLLMANKMSRDEAVRLAWAVHDEGYLSYSAAWVLFWPQLIGY